MPLFSTPNNAPGPTFPRFLGCDTQQRPVPTHQRAKLSLPWLGTPDPPHSTCSAASPQQPLHTHIYITRARGHRMPAFPRQNSLIDLSSLSLPAPLPVLVQRHPLGEEPRRTEPGLELLRKTDSLRGAFPHKPDRENQRGQRTQLRSHRGRHRHRQPHPAVCSGVGLGSERKPLAAAGSPVRLARHGKR